ncbi:MULTISPECIES: MFS transporter [Prauserella salsuginis group]|uniref:AAHS family benzoate transporter-like MFS transporter n=2 Tax=Prauserella salsuginis group TaxID=2893672 RepID=A0A839XMZ9_9PSEU|nr:MULTISPECIES: MFS transporter [Prauserella salsuginis group]MBB3661366.1 AAHS family benzoate transporter-like MFS transporter [Prauserella sediminis]MCR3719288.1 MFS transporter, AAHS family, benzoate transport protein [Prauserella flava]MCR3735699.1 MFS transporter, AAHS family, benzoate transport protein [Prauserella salsuginis]
MSDSDATKRRRTVFWVVALSAISLVFDGYDLVVYGTVLPILLDDPSHLGAISPQQGGALGSYALIGVLVGALAAGTFGDLVGRRRIMLLNLAWFSLGMAFTAMTTSVMLFGIGRFFTGIGVGALVGTVGAIVAEFAPTHQRNRLNAIVYSGIPAGGVLASLLALALTDVIGWRGLFWIGAVPIVTVLPLALMKLPESAQWLASRGRHEQARAVADRTGMQLLPETGSTGGRVGFPALATRALAWPTMLLGTMSFAGLLLTYGLNTWLPEIMGASGYGESYSLAFLLVLNGGAIVGGLLASAWADRTGAKRVVSTTFVLAAITLALLPLDLPLVVLLLAVAVAGTGTIGTQVLIYGLVSNYYPTRARGAGVAWCAGFGRLGGIGGPVIGGLLVGAGLGGMAAFYIFAGIALLAALVTMLVPRPAHETAHEATAQVGQPEPV